MDYQFELVGKIGSMALIRQEDRDIDYNIFSRIGAELKPGMIWVTSGATEIGRLDYLKRTGCELCGDPEQDKADYSAQGQAILMQNYRQFIAPEYGVRQILVEHTHFNDPEKSEHIRQLLIRAEKDITDAILSEDEIADRAHTAGKGTGLGLSICRRIAEMHGQTLKLLDTEEGAAFRFTLEYAPDAGTTA